MRGDDDSLMCLQKLRHQSCANKNALEFSPQTAAKRRKNAIHGASRGRIVKMISAP